MAILDGVTNDIDDADTLAVQCAQGAAMGFDGKTLIHPSQIEAANRAFSPDAAEIAWSRKIVAAFAAEGSVGTGVLRVEGRMVERLHLARARWVIGGERRVRRLGVMKPSPPDPPPSVLWQLDVAAARFT